jgi:hypothetical protein
MEPNSSVQFEEPLQALPQARGRARYVEFIVEELNIGDGAMSELLCGFALPGLANGDLLGRTKSSICVDVKNGLLFDGLRFGSPLLSSIPKELKAGDIFGIGMCYECHVDELHMDCFFATFNGKLIASKRCLTSSNRGFYMTYLHTKDICTSFRVNRGQKRTFSFDIEGFQKEHAQHQLFKTYLPVSSSLFNERGSTDYWIEERIANMFGYASHYVPIAKAMKRCTSQNWAEICRLQLGLQYWNRILYLFHTLTSDISASIEDDHSVQWPSPFDSEESLDRLLESHSLPVLPAHKIQDIPAAVQSKRRSYLIRLTRVRSALHLEIARMVRNAISKRPPIQDDADPLVARGGMLEGWSKLAIFLHETLDEQPGDSEWIHYVRDATLDSLIEEGLSLTDCCPGFLKDGLEQEGIDEVGKNGDREDESSQHEQGQDRDGDESPDDEECFASEMTAIGADVIMWASWASMMTEGLERELKSLQGVDLPPAPLIEHDHTLYVISKALVDQRDLTPAWVLMQFKSWGFSKESPLNVIPKTFDEAVVLLDQFFTKRVEMITDDQWKVILSEQRILEESDRGSQIPPSKLEDLLHLAHVWELATQSFPGSYPLAKALRKYIPSSIIYQHPPPEVPQRFEKPLPPIVPSPENPPQKPTSSVDWALMGTLTAVGIASAAVGAAIAVFVSRKMNSK